MLVQDEAVMPGDVMTVAWGGVTVSVRLECAWCVCGEGSHSHFFYDVFVQ